MDRSLVGLWIGLFAVSALAMGASPSANSDPPLVNWSAPATYSPPGRSAAHPLALQIVGTGPFPFFPISPCRQYDSRNSTALSDNTPRTVNVSGAPCNIPSSAMAVSANITVFSITGATGNGVFKVGTSSPPTTAWINYPPSETQRANAGTLATDGSGNIVVQVNQGGGSVNFTVDVNGYYYNGNVSSMPAGDFFSIQGDRQFGGVLFAQNLDSAGLNAFGVDAITNSTGAGSAGVVGESFGLSGVTSGVKGNNMSVSNSASGVLGQILSSSPGFSSAGVKGVNNGTGFSGFGVLGTHNGSGIGVEGSSLGSTGIGAIGVYGYANSGANETAGVEGIAFSTSGRTYGVFGQSFGAMGDDAGVKGVDASGSPAGVNFFPPAGVRGESASNAGLLGLSESVGVEGVVLDSSGTILAGGFLGTKATSINYGVYSFGNFAASGTKSFVEPYPADASKVIRYVSLEGPESGTYFRGSAQIVNGRAVIEVPEDFRIVTDVEGLTVQLTPVGQLATMAVVSEDLNQIVVQSNRDVKFHYMVNGVRKAFKDHRAIAPGDEFMPRSPEERMPGYLTEEAKRRLIVNGTYNADGSVNMTTAERVGWTKIWSDRKAAAEEAAKAASSKAAAMTRQGQQPQ